MIHNPQARFERRGSSGSILEPRGIITVERMEWSVYGGPKRARLKLTGSPADLWDAIDCLSYRIEITESGKYPVWWGMVNEVSVQTENGQFGLSLDDLYNRIMVTYSYVAPGTTTVGERRDTEWIEDANSIEYFGYRELRLSQAGLTEEEAIATRDTALSISSWPVAPPSLEATGEVAATIHCVGWWDTLDWRYYANSSTAAVDTTEQIETIISTSGQFITGVDSYIQSGIVSSQYRNGENRALFEIEKLLKMGGPNKRRLLADVLPSRGVRIYEEPSKYATLLYTPDNCIVSSVGDVEVEPANAVGQWIRLIDFVPYDADLHLIDPTLQFIEGGVWTPRTGFRPRFRGTPTVRELMEVQE